MQTGELLLDDQRDKRRQEAILSRYITTLTPWEEFVIRASFFEDKTKPEISRDLKREKNAEVPCARVKGIINRAISKLKKRMVRIGYS